MVRHLLTNTLENKGLVIYKFFKIFYVLVGFVGPMVAAADSCVKYKEKIKSSVVIPKYNVSVVQPIEFMNKYHGNVVATLVQDFDLTVDVVATNGGYCVILKNVNATFGYDDFAVKIDRLYHKNSCAYNAILGHEYRHIDVYLSVIKDLDMDIKNSVINSANSVMPIFVQSREDIESGISEMNMKIQSHPEIILLKQKINAAVEIRNKRIDQNEDNTDLNKC